MSTKNPRPALGTEKRWMPGLPADRKRRRLNAKSVAKMMRMMLGGKPTMHELVAESGLCVHTVRAYIKAMHLERTCHISGWAQDRRGAYMTPRWSLGALPDAARPLPLEGGKRMRAQRLRAKMLKAGQMAPSAAQIARAA